MGVGRGHVVEQHPAALLEIAERAARRAGSLLLDLLGTTPAGLRAKSTPSDMVSDADRCAEAVIAETIWEARSDDVILGEEGGIRTGAGGEPHESEVSWIVDPLDGTTNWLHGIPAWAVSVAAEHEGELVAGAVYAPVDDEMFSAATGCGAGVQSVPLDMRSSSSPASSDLPLVATGFAYEPEIRHAQGHVIARIMPHVRDIRRGGSAALDLAYVAAGRLDAYFEVPVAVWDIAAGQVLVREAGGIILPLTLPGVPGEGVLATRPDLVVMLRDRLTRSDRPSS